MRIGMVCPYSLSRPGGVQGQALGLAAALRRRGHAVWVLAPGPGRDPAGIDDGASAIAADNPDSGGTVVVGRSIALPANGSIAPVALWPGAARRAREKAIEAKVDLVHLHEPFAPTLGYGFMVRPVLPMVGTFHRSGLHVGYRIITPLARRLGSRLAVRCAVSEAALATAGHVVSGPFELLFNGVDLADFEPAETSTEVSGAEEGATVDESDEPDAAPVPPGSVSLLFLGRHEPRKGLLVLLEAFRRVGEEANAVLWIAGNGPMTGELRRRFPPGPRHVWLGVLSEEDKVRRLGAADVLCAPALGGESFGMVLVEGMAARTAVLASDISGYRGAAGGQAELVEPGDVAAWAEAIVRLAAEVRSGTGRASPEALDRAAAHASGWSMDRLAACYEERYDRALGAR
jgi:phosphatidyl-myo-inositol alpha-mannosyltransferase